MEYLGNKELLKLPKTAFLASSTIPIDMVLRCYDWAVKMRDEGRCVISGFSSRLERDVWDFLIGGQQPVILVLARIMYHHLPKDLLPLIDSGRLLIISTSVSPRQSRATAFARNRYVCELADEIVLVGADEGSSLERLKKEFAEKMLYLELRDNRKS